MSPAFGSLAGLPSTLMFFGTRDTLAPGCRLLTTRAVEDGWDLAVVQEPDLIHVYGLLPFVPEARVALAQAASFVR